MVGSSDIRRRWRLALPVLVAVAGCSDRQEVSGAPALRTDIVLITLDTVRADALGYEGGPAATPTLDALAREGMRFEQAYTTAPTTLPAHASMLTGLYPAAHGLHENGRRLRPEVALLAEDLNRLGYSTAAFVSGYPLARRFGLERGFDFYDDDFGGAVERTAGETTDKVLGFLAARDAGPLFLWVHYYDAHDPYEPPEPFASRWSENPYYGEVEYLDRELGRLVEGLQIKLGDPALLIVGDHGEGLGDHGEQRHGNLLYQGVMRVPLLVIGANVEAAGIASPVSIRRVFHTVLGMAGGDPSGSLMGAARAEVTEEGEAEEVVAAEAMKPFLQYGWQPQVMAVAGSLKAIQSGPEIELFDVVADPEEQHDLAQQRRPTPAMIEALRTYPLPTVEAVDPVQLSDQERRNLAALGYVSSSEPPTLRADAPVPGDMTELFDDLDRGSALFVEERWDESIALFERVAREDPRNLMVQLRLAVAHSLSGRPDEAERHFRAAEQIAPDSVDRKRYLALHHCRLGRWQLAEAALTPLLPDLGGSVPALQCLAEARLRRGAPSEAVPLLTTAAELQPDSTALQVRLGEAQMALGQTGAAIGAFEQARRLDPTGFDRHLELGVLYLSSGRLKEAGRELESVPADHPGYPMALFKRAQASVLLREPDHLERIRLAWEHADETTRPLIERESLFRGVPLGGAD